MAIHEDGYLQSLQFNINDTMVTIPLHDLESVHNQAGSVTTNLIADGAITEDKLSDDLVDDLQEIRDSVSPKLLGASSTAVPTGQDIGAMESHAFYVLQLSISGRILATTLIVGDEIMGGLSLENGLTAAYNSHCAYAHVSNGRMWLGVSSSACLAKLYAWG